MKNKEVYQTPILTIGTEFNKSVVKNITNSKDEGVFIHTENGNKYSMKEVENVCLK